MTRADARALCDAGYMSVKEYIRLCEERGWASLDDQFDDHLATSGLSALERSPETEGLLAGVLSCGG
jgi:hypothetical protein